MKKEQMVALLENVLDVGFAAIPNVLSNNEISTLRTAYDRQFALGLAGKVDVQRIESPWHFEGDDRERVSFQLTGLSKSCSEFRDLQQNAAIRFCIHSLLGGTVRCFGDQAMLKPAHGGCQINWHQDNAWWCFDPPDAITAWLPLDDAVQESGGIRIIPNKHRSLMIDSQSTASARILAAETIDEAAAVDLDAKPGDLLIWHCLTPHFSPVNKSSQSRRAYAMHFCSPSLAIGRGIKLVENDCSPPASS